MSSRQAALSLYRRSLKLALDWAVHRHLWRGQAIYIRSLFEANRNITEPRQQRALLKETEKILDSWKHPDPYAPPTAPGGSKYERNLPAPILDLIYISEQGEQRPGRTSQGLEAQKAPVLSSYTRTRTMLQLAKSSRSPAQALAKHDHKRNPGSKDRDSHKRKGIKGAELTL
ncbi:hypothetical protein LA080_009248 [Diaporthe eres]|nr:hypothetical protein LA080_009248 [Diaporthe eres]